MLQDRINRARILIVDDEEDNVQVLRRILEAEGYTDLESTNDPTQIADLVAAFDPDLVMMDVIMPGVNGLDALRMLRKSDAQASYRPVMVLTSDHSRQAQRDAWSAGAKDFLTKPLSPSEVRHRVRNLLETRMLHRTLHEHADELENRVRERTAELEEARIQVLFRLARAAEYRDDDTGHHTRRVGRSSGRIAQALGLPRSEATRIRMAAPLHDVGKIGIPDSILLSTKKLSKKDREIMKDHCRIGAALLSSPDVPLLGLAADIALTHHEWWNGGGYPQGLEGPDTPLAGRIVAVADTFDALTHARPYKKAWPVDEALREIRRLSGVAFDPNVVDVFEELVRSADLGTATVEA